MSAIRCKSGLAALTLAASLAACGSSGGSSALEATATSTTRAAAAPATAVPTAATTPPTTPPPTTPPPTTEPSTTAPLPPTVGDGLSASCLQGEWIMDQGTTDLFYATLLPFAPVSVPSGSVSVTFTGERVRWFTNIAIKFTVPEGYVQTTLDTLQEGTFVVTGRQLLVNVEQTTGGYGPFTGELAGVAVNVPSPGYPAVPPIAGGPAQCTGNRLSIQYTSGVSDAIAYFDRAR